MTTCASPSNHWVWQKKKKTLRSSQDLNLGPLNSGQMLLPMSYWSSGIGAEDRWHLSIDTVQFSGWISLRLGELCRISTEVVCAATSELGKSSSYSVCASFIGADRKHFSLQWKAIQSAYASLRHSPFHSLPFGMLLALMRSLCSGITEVKACCTSVSFWILNHFLCVGWVCHVIWSLCD